MEAANFLEQLRPGGPWVLTAIDPDIGQLETITVNTTTEAEAFVRQWNGRRNLYYSVNPTRTVMTKKAAKTDIAAIEYALADLDPNDDETPAAAKTRYLTALNGEMQPTAIIDSGNGIQALWRLTKAIALGAPVTVNNKLQFTPEDQSKIDDIEARAKALMLRLGATSGTQNVDRILRLPGTINLPNELKRKKGRVQCRTRLLAFNGASYAVDAFLKPTTNDSATSSATTERVLPPAVGALLHLPNNGAGNSCGGYASRSELLFAFLKLALRAGANEDVITAAVLDHAFAGKGIYEHVRENKNRDPNYLKRQLERAKQEPARTEQATDLGNARRLIRVHGTELRYVPGWNRWLYWHDGHWHSDDDGAVIRTAKATVEAMFVEAGLINDEARRTAARRYALQCQSVQRIIAMIKLAESESEIVLAVDQIDADPLLLGVTNGVIDLRNQTFRAARQDDYVTKFAAVAYDAAAQCPQWETFLRKVLTDDELIAYLQRAVGYILTGLTGEEVMFVWWGNGFNGKSTARETIFALLGDYAVGSDASLLMTRKQSGAASPDLARLFGRRLVTINETEKNDVLNDQKVKFITGHDVITARNLYEQFFDFTPTHKSILTTNHKPIVRGTDEAIWRRIHLVPFVKTIPLQERNINFREQVLLPELPGILNWALTGLAKYQKGGLKPPALVTDATKEYRDDMDLVGQWIDERCDLVPAAEHTAAALYQDYQTWAMRDVGFTLSPITFGRELSSRGFERKKVKGQKGWQGLKLKPLPM